MRKKEREKEIVFVNQATGYLTIDIINVFASHFDRVALIAGSIRVQDIEIDQKVQWSKITKYNRGNPRKKLFSWMVGAVQIFFLLLFKFRRYEVFYITIPPFAYLLSLILPNKFSILVFDVYPDVLKIYGAGKQNTFYRLWQRWNRKIFMKAHFVYTIGEGMAKLLDNYMERDKMRIIPLWTGLTEATPIRKNENRWLKKLGLENKFIIQYSGNIGYTHNVEVLLELAREMKENLNCHFLIIGRGDKVKHISNLIEEYSLENCTLLPFQPDDVLIYSLAAADIGVVILDETVANVSLPSKIYNLQAVGVPILGISPLGTELAEHLEKYNNGMCLRQDEPGRMKEFILELVGNKDKLRDLSLNSVKAAEDFTILNAQKFFNEYV